MAGRPPGRPQEVEVFLGEDGPQSGQKGPEIVPPQKSESRVSDLRTKTRVVFRAYWNPRRLSTSCRAAPGCPPEGGRVRLRRSVPVPTMANRGTEPSKARKQAPLGARPSAAGGSRSAPPQRTLPIISQPGLCNSASRASLSTSLHAVMSRLASSRRRPSSSVFHSRSRVWAIRATSSQPRAAALERKV